MEFVRFESTLWSRISLVKRQDTRAVNEFILRYRAPVVNFVRNAGFGEQDAEDLAQEIFLRLTADNVLARADRDRGRFRSFLLGVTQNVMREERRRRGAEKRGGGRVPVSLDAGEAEMAELIPQEHREEQFDKLWVEGLVKAALGELEREKPEYYRALALHLNRGMEYQDIARQMGGKLQDVKNWIHRARARLVELVKQEVARYASSPQEYEEELAYLSKFIAG